MNTFSCAQNWHFWKILCLILPYFHRLWHFLMQRFRFWVLCSWIWLGLFCSCFWVHYRVLETPPSHTSPLPLLVPAAPPPLPHPLPPLLLDYWSWWFVMDVYPQIRIFPYETFTVHCKYDLFQTCSFIRLLLNLIDIGDTTLEVWGLNKTRDFDINCF